MKPEKTDVITAHRFSANNKPALKKDRVCGCFYCLKIFSPDEIGAYIEGGSDGQGTAVCPYCGIDSVIGEGSGFPVTEEFLRKMKEHWFDSAKENT